MKLINRIIILIIIISVLLGTNMVFGTNNIAKVVQQKKLNHTGGNIILIIVFIIEIATIFLVKLNNKDNKIKTSLILLSIFGILTLCAILTNMIVNINYDTLYNSLHYLALKLIFITGIPFVFLIICLPIILIKEKSKK